MSIKFINKIKIPLILITTLVLLSLFGAQIPLQIKSICYALSLSIKSILEFVLPFVIFSFIFYCLSNLQKGAIFFVFLLITCVFVSNFSALMVGYSSGYIGLHFLEFTATPIHSGPQLLPAWSFHLTKLVSNDTALLSGFAIGIFFSLWPNPQAKKIAINLNWAANLFLKKIFIPFLPLFILGFVFKLEHEHLLKTSLSLYGPILVLVVITQWLYIGSWYFIASQFSFKKFAFYLKNVLPACFTGFSTISSAAAMPVLLLATEKNLDNAEQAKMLVPAIINIHTLGSAIGIPILSLATLITFGMPMPSPTTFIIFALYTALAKYAVAGVPGGVIIVVAPILEAHLGFSSDMTGLITAIYLICDPFGTTANVGANGAFPIIFSRLHKRLSQSSKSFLPITETLETHGSIPGFGKKSSRQLT